MINSDKDKDRILIFQETSETLSSEEAFILSRIGAEIRLHDLYSLLPFLPSTTNEHLKALFQKKFLRWKDAKSDRTYLQGASKKVDTEPTSGAPPAPGRPVKNEKLSDEVLEILQSDLFDPDLRVIDKEFRKDILTKSEGIESKNPFDILGISNRANDDEVHQAYILLSRKFHPDRFFRKKLGHYKRRLDFLFTQIQESYKNLKNSFDREAVARQLKVQVKSTEPKSANTPQRKLDPAIEKIGKAEHFFKLGQTALKLKDYSQAATQFQLAYQVNPTRPQYKKAYDQVSPFLEIHRAEEMIKSAEDSLSHSLPLEAIELAERALRISPESTSAKFVLARAIFEAGEKSRISEALDLLRRVKAAVPRNPDACVLLSQIYYAKKDPSKALKEIEEALRRDPNCALAHKLLSKYSA